MHALKITDYDGLNVDLTTHKIFDWVPRSSQGAGSVEEGGVALVTDTSAARALKRDLTRAFNKARAWEELKEGAPVYVEFTPGAADTPLRARLKRGRAEIGGETFNAARWYLGNVKIMFSYTRAPYWEEVNPVTLSLVTASVPGGSTSPVRIYSGEYGGGSNWVEVGDTLQGDLPAPPTLKLKNDDASNRTIGTVLIGHKTRGDVSAFTHLVECEDFTTSPIATSYVNAGASGGDYVKWDFSGTSTYVVATYTLPTSTANNAGGGHYKILLNHFLPNSTGIWLQAVVKANGFTLWEGDWVAAGTLAQYTDLGSVQLPPGLVGQVSAYPLTLELKAKSYSSGNHALYGDYFLLLPLDSFRKLKGGIGPDPVTLNDEIGEDKTYTVGWAAYPTSHINNIIIEGGPVHLKPEQTQRIYFYLVEDSGNCEPSLTLTVQIQYRPRYDSI